MEGQIESFTRDLKFLIIKYKLSFMEVNQALAMLDVEMEEDRKEARNKGKK